MLHDGITCTIKTTTDIGEQWLGEEGNNLCIFPGRFWEMAYSRGSPIFDKMSSYRSTVLDKSLHTNALGLRPPQTLVCLCPQSPLVSGATAQLGLKPALFATVCLPTFSNGTTMHLNMCWYRSKCLAGQFFSVIGLVPKLSVTCGQEPSLFRLLPRGQPQWRAKHLVEIRRLLSDWTKVTTVESTGVGLVFSGLRRGVFLQGLWVLTPHKPPVGLNQFYLQVIAEDWASHLCDTIAEPPAEEPYCPLGLKALELHLVLTCCPECMCLCMCLLLWRQESALFDSHPESSRVACMGGHLLCVCWANGQMDTEPHCCTSQMAPKWYTGGNRSLMMCFCRYLEMLLEAFCTELGQRINGAEGAPVGCWVWAQALGQMIQDLSSYFHNYCL